VRSVYRLSIAYQGVPAVSGAIRYFTQRLRIDACSRLICSICLRDRLAGRVTEPDGGEALNFTASREGFLREAENNPDGLRARCHAGTGALHAGIRERVPRASCRRILIAPSRIPLPFYVLALCLRRLILDELVITGRARRDKNKITEDPAADGFQVTKIGAPEAFLREGNVTLLFGREEKGSGPAVRSSDSCKTREQFVKVLPPTQRRSVRSCQSREGPCRRAVCFVMDVQRFERF